MQGLDRTRGVVICGDTQETQAATKRNVNKVRVEPENAAIRAVLGGIDLSAVFCGAGDGPFVDMLIEKAWSSAKSARTLDEACPLIEEEIKSVYREYATIYQPGQCPSVEIIYGVKAEGQSRMFLASGPTIVEKRRRHAKGDLEEALQDSTRRSGSSRTTPPPSTTEPLRVARKATWRERCGITRK